MTHFNSKEMRLHMSNNHKGALEDHRRENMESMITC